MYELLGVKWGVDVIKGNSEFTATVISCGATLVLCLLAIGTHASQLPSTETRAELDAASLELRQIDYGGGFEWAAEYVVAFVADDGRVFVVSDSSASYQDGL